MMPISHDLLSEHDSFFPISKVVIVSFAEISKQMRVLCCLWSLSSEEMESESGLSLRQQHKNNTTLKR